MSDVNANIRIGVDSTQAISSLKSLQSQISAFNKGIVASNAQALAAQSSALSGLTAQIGATKQFSTSIVNVESSVSRLGKAIDKNKLSLGEYFRYGTASTKNFGRVFGREHTQIMDLASERVKRLQTQYIALSSAQNGMTKAMAVRPLNLFNADAAISVQRQQIFNKLLRDGSTSLINFGKNTQWAGRQLMVGFTVPLTIFGGIAGQIFMDLERQVVNFRRVYGDAMTPSGETDQMIEEIKGVAKEFTKYGIAVKDTVGLASDIAATGAQGEDLVAATAQSTRLATLGMIEMNQAMDATISLQTAFKLSNEELANSVNFLNAVENQTVLSLDDVTVAIPKVAPIIKGLGGDVQDLAFFLTAMREGGVNAAEGANALKSGLASLINPTKGAREQLEKVGINIDSIIKTNKGDIRATVQEFGNALMTLDKFSRQQTLAKVFGKYQFARLGALFENINRDGSQAQRVLDLTGQSIEELAGLADKELGAIEESIGMKFTGAVERLKLALAPIGEVFLRIATPIIDFATKILEKFNELSPGVKQFISVIVAGVGVVVPTVIMLIGLFGNFIGQAIKGFAVFNSLFNRLRGGGKDLQYLSNEELDAAAAAASLEGKTESLTSALNVQRSAVNQLARAYGGYVKAANAAATGLPQGFGKAPRRMATGGMVGGSGSRDTEPALLTPGEFVMNRQATEKFAPILDAMNRGTVSGYAEGSRLTKQSGAESRQFKSSAFVLRGLGSNISAGGTGTGILSDILSISAKNISDVTSLYVSEISKSANTSVNAINKEIKAWQNKNSAYLEEFNRKLAAAIQSGDIAGQQKLINEASQKFSTDMQKANGPVAKFAAQAQQDFPKLSSDLSKTQQIIKNTTKDLSDARQSAAFFEENMKETALLSKLSKPGTYQPQARAAAGALPLLGNTDFQTYGVPAQFIDPKSRATAGRASAYGLSQSQSLAVYKAGTSAEHLSKTPQQLKKEADLAANIYAKEYSQSISEQDPTGKGLMNEVGRNSPHRQARKNAVEDATAYSQTYEETVQSGARRRRGATRPGTISPLALRSGEESTRIANIENAHALALEENTRRTKDQSSKISKFGNALTKGSAKLTGAMFAMDGVIFAASMMNNSMGEFAQKIMPAVFAVQGVAMVMPMISGGIKALAVALGMTVPALLAVIGPIALVAAALGGLAIVAKIQADKQNEMIRANQKYIDATLGSASAMTNFAKATNSRTLMEREAALSAPFATIGEKQKTFAEEFVATESGAQITESLKLIAEGPQRIAALRAQLIQAIASGFLSPKQAKAVARQVSIELRDPILGNSVIASIESALTKNGKRLKQAASEAFFGTLITPEIVPEIMIAEEAISAVQDVYAQIPARKPKPTGAGQRGGVDNTARAALTAVTEAESLKLTKEQGGAAFQIAATNVTKLREAIALLNIDLAEGNIQQKEYDDRLKIANDRMNSQISIISNLGVAVDGGSDAVGGFFKNYALMMGMTEENFTKVEQSVENIGNMLSKKPKTFTTDLKFSVVTGGMSIEQLTTLESFFSLGEGRGEKLRKEFEILINTEGNYTPEQVTNFFLSIAGYDDQIRKTVQVRFTENGLNDAKNYISVLSLIMQLPPRIRNIIEPQIAGIGIEGLKTAKYYLDYLNDIPAKQRKDYIIAVTQLVFRKNIGEALTKTQESARAGSARAQAGLNRAESKGFTPQTGTSADDIAKQLEKDLENYLSGIGEGGAGDGTGGDGGGDGGSATKSWLQQLIDDTQANLALFPGMLNRLKGVGIPEQIIEMIGGGEEGLKRAKELLGISREKLNKLIADFNKNTINEIIKSTKQATEKAQQKNMATDILISQGMSREDANAIASDSENALAIITAAGDKSGKSIKKLVDAFKELQSVPEFVDPIKNKLEEINNIYKAQMLPLQQKIDKQQEIVNSIQEEIDELQKLSGYDQDRIRDLERQKEMIQRQIEEYERANELDQRRIDTLQRQDELRNRESDALSHELDVLSDMEQKIRDAYQERIDALTTVANLNDDILERQKDQLGVSQALAEGDIYAATAAAQQMRQNQIKSAQQLSIDALNQARDNSIAGLVTSGGLTRDQAEERIRQIKEQSYQTSLLVRDIEDEIFNRNQLMIPLKDQQLNIDRQIRDISDIIYDRESKIINIQRERLDPQTQILKNITDQASELKKNLDIQSGILDGADLLNSMTDEQITAAGLLGSQWHEVAKQIQAAQVLASNKKASLIIPDPKNFEGKPKKYAAALEKYNADVARIDAEAQVSVDAAIATGQAAMNKNMGGKIMKYARGNIVGSGGMDSVPAMLTPGEYVIRKAMVDKYGTPMFDKINQGSFSMPSFNTGEKLTTSISGTSGPSTNVVAPMYNNYSVNVSVSNSGASADEIANKTLMKIKQLQNTQIRSGRGY